MSQFNIILKALRVESNMTLAEAAWDSGYTVSQIHNWEVGRVGVTLNTLTKLAEYWGVSVGQLVGSVKTPKLNIVTLRPKPRRRVAA